VAGRKKEKEKKGGGFVYVPHRCRVDQRGGGGGERTEVALHVPAVLSEKKRERRLASRSVVAEALHAREGEKGRCSSALVYQMH